MRQPIYVTTSWNDGHPLNFRIADLLTKYGLPGTFYIPRTAERETMTADEIRVLGAYFEIGANTMRHVELTSAEPLEAEDEISESKFWLEWVLGRPCRMFCFPRGKFRNEHVSMVREAGYLGARTGELLSTSFPAPRKGVLLMPTTVQAYPKSANAYVKNATRRLAIRSLWWFVLHGRGMEWPQLAEALWSVTRERGGVFHLCGHAWEIDHKDQWRRLEQVFQFLSQHRDEATWMTNGDICASVARGPSGKINPSRRQT